MKPGIYRSLPAEQYHGSPGCHYSTLKHARRSLAHAREQVLHPSEPTAAQLFGTAFHAAALQPVYFASAYAQPPTTEDEALRNKDGTPSKRTKEGQAIWAAWGAEHHGATVVSRDDYAALSGMVAAVVAHPLALALLAASGDTEVALYWQDPEHGTAMRGRLDVLCDHDGTTVVDLKETRDASPGAFARDVARYDYHLQAAMYLDGLAALAGERRRRFLWVAVERERPYGVAVYEPTPEALEQGWRDYRWLLARWAEAERTGEWPSYPVGAQQLHLPPWAMTREL